MTNHRFLSWVKRISVVIAQVLLGTPAQIRVVERVVNAPLPVQKAYRRAQSSLLAAQLASQAKLNVPIGRKPRLAAARPTKKSKPKPLLVREIKRGSKVRSVFLQARHSVAQMPSKPTAAVVALPTAPKHQRPIVATRNTKLAA
jgi:hypothetical protein